MPITKNPPRYGHSEGHTDICYVHSGETILTCGSDGDVRIWKGFEDDDPETINVGERVWALAVKNGHFVTASDNNTVQAHTFPEGAPDGILARFTAPVNHIQFNKSGTKLLAGASDFSIKLVTLEDSSQKLFEGHNAPVLSVAFDPMEEYLASSSCDGTIKIWRVEDQSWEKSLSILPKCSDFSISKTLCRLSWEPTVGKYLVLPVDKEIQVIERDTWDLSFSLTNESVTSTVTIATWSSCGNYIAGACVNGTIFIWDVGSRECIESIKNDKGVGICGLVWHPKNCTQIAYTDTSGQLGFLENVVPEEQKNRVQNVVANNTNQYADLFDDDDGNDEALLKAVTQAKQNAPIVEDEDDNDRIGAAHHRKSIYNGIEDDDSIDGVTAQAITEAVEPPKPQVIYEAPKTTPLQKPFISAATPVHLTSRFMKWNNVGIIRSYDSEDESSIDVEFHDSSVHHALHIDNQLNYTIADLSSEAVALASGRDDDQLSQLTCLHFGSWDTQKEWSTSMPKGEDITTVCLGWNWLAVGTDKRLIRTFSIGGVQHEVFAVPGPIVSISGYGNQLIVVYHMGIGVPGDQCLGLKLLQLKGKKRQVISGEMLPITPKSTLVWLGFSEEGSPVTVDSEGVVRMLSREMMSWIPIANTKTVTKSRSDHYWVIGVNEDYGQLRCIPCKGSTFPPTLPRPAATVLPFKIPICDGETEKGQLEEKLLKANLFSEHHKYDESQGYEVNENSQSESIRNRQEALMKLFALACKTDREYRAAEICELMKSQHELNLAIKYASRLRRITLAQKLSEIVKRKMEEELEAEDREDDDDQCTDRYDTRKSGPRWMPRSRQSNHDEEDEEMEEEENDAAESEKEDMEEEEDDQEDNCLPTLKLKPKKDLLPKSLIPSSQEKRNPFKSNIKKVTTPSARGTSVFDVMKLSSAKTGTKNGGSDAHTISLPKSKKKTQPTLLSMKSKIGENASSCDSNGVKSKKPNTAFGLWMEENVDNLKEKNPDKTDADITKIAMTMWKTFSSEERKEWSEKMKALNAENPGQTDENVKNRKRKMTEQTQEKAKRSNVESGRPAKIQAVEDDATKKPLSTTTNSKLSSFMFSKK